MAKFKSKTIRLKVILLGDKSSGKTSLIKKFCEDKFTSKYMPTVGVDFGVKSAFISNNENEIRVNFWDVSGDIKYRSAATEIIKDMKIDAVFIIFDVSNRTSFNNLTKWIELINVHNANYQIAIIANKIDLNKVVTEEEIKTLCTANNARYFQISANTGENIPYLFNETFAIAVKTKMNN